MWRFVVKLARPMVLDADFEVDSVRDSVLVIVGPNGAGKSTLLRAMAGFLGPDQGGALAGPPWRRPMAWIPQAPSLLVHRTIRQQVEWVLRGRLNQSSDLLAWANWLGLEPLLDLKPPSLSGGQQQRAALLRALASRPQILALDEALNQVDAPSREAISVRLRDWAEADHARLLILTTHQFGDFAHLADQVLVMAEGKILRYGAPQNLISDPGSWAVAALLGYTALVRHDDGDYVFGPEDVKRSGDGMHLPVVQAKESPEKWRVRLAVRSGRTDYVVEKNPEALGIRPTVVSVQGVRIAREEERE